MIANSDIYDIGNKILLLPSLIFCVIIGDKDNDNDNVPTMYNCGAKNEKLSQLFLSGLYIR